ncbi:MAG: GTPase Era, partial [Candidatus Omnitrophica bacterium]|nr:GTPase Era [Candidatus Omnitrophota bacterium]MBD3269098.1 GTPase Era [Candidatus Omnitrophota bacterium]
MLNSEKEKTKGKTGFVAIIGRPNTGKSTLLNNILGRKISIISSVPQTTRYQIRGILNINNSQIVFIDTPGMHSFKDKLAAHLNTVAKKSLEGCDLAVYVVDSSRRVGREEQKLARIAANSGIKIVMVLNKIDLGGRFLGDYIKLWQAFIGGEDKLLYYLPLSAKTGKNVDKLKEILLENLPSGEMFYPPE